MIIFLLACISAYLYRLGGKESYNTKFRDLGVPVVATIALWLLGVKSWLLILHFGLLFAALTTYYDSIFGKDNFYAHGAGIGLAVIPLLWCNVRYAIIGRVILLALSFGLINKYVNNGLFHIR